MKFSSAIRRLEAAFGRPLPGAAAQDLLVPFPRREWPSGPAHVRDAAGLVLLFPIDGCAHLVLTVRAGTLGRHGGQVSLPGGVVDPGETLAQAALREAHEETALSLDEVRVLGELTPLDIPVSGFRLHPVVAATTAHPRFTAADGEVARILEVAVDDLLDPAHLVATERVAEGRVITVPGFRVAGEEIWGATAMVLAELLVLLGWAGPSNQ